MYLQAALKRPTTSVPPRPSLRSTRHFIAAWVWLGLSLGRPPAAGAEGGPDLLSVPRQPTLPSPAHTDTVAGMPITVQARVSDPNGDSLKVTFYGRAVATAGPDFTLIEIPDTQYYTSSMNGGTPAMFTSQTNWIAANRTIRNIAAVVHVGDIVESQENNGNNVEWVAADSCMRPLEDPVATLLPEGIPYGISPGNHDIAGAGGGTFDQFFGAARFQGRSYYGGHYGADNANWFELWSASGLDFIVIGMKLMWVQAPGPLQWADSLLSAYPNRRAILVSHYLLDPGPPVTFSPQGQSIYDALKGHANLILMLCGHYVNDARRSDTYRGHTIHTVMSNYQNIGRGGDGWLRIMEFSPAHNHIRMRTYSPWLGQFMVSPDSSKQFTLPLDLGGGDNGFHPIGTFRRVGSGTTPSIRWAGLCRGKAYEWYVTASDATSQTNGPIWRFTIDDKNPPVARVTAPNGGETLAPGQWADLRWDATDDGSGMRDVSISLSHDGGTWTTVASDYPNTGLFRWLVEGPTTQNAYFNVVVRDSFNNWSVDACDHPFQIVAQVAVGDGPGGSTGLDPVSPNPTRGPTRFGLTLGEPGSIRLEILDVAGRLVAVITDGFEAAGRLELAWNGRSAGRQVPPGLYVARLRAPGRVLTRSFVISR